MFGHRYGVFHYIVDHDGANGNAGAQTSKFRDRKRGHYERFFSLEESLESLESFKSLKSLEKMVGFSFVFQSLGVLWNL